MCGCDGVVYLGRSPGTAVTTDYNSDGVQALNAADGSTLWWQSSSIGNFATPTVANSVLYTAGCWDGNSVCALDASNGLLLWWDTPTSAGIGASPIVANGQLYVVDKGGTLYAYGKCC
jgi:outer membrane protein assembly factor BamB